MTFEGLTIFTLACSPLHRQTIQATAWNLKLSKLNTCTAFYFQIDNKLRASPARRHRKDHKLLIKVHKRLLFTTLRLREIRDIDSGHVLFSANYIRARILECYQMSSSHCII